MTVKFTMLCKKKLFSQNSFLLCSLNSQGSKTIVKLENFEIRVLVQFLVKNGDFFGVTLQKKYIQYIAWRNGLCTHILFNMSVS